MSISMLPGNAMLFYTATETLVEVPFTMHYNCISEFSVKHAN